MRQFARLLFASALLCIGLGLYEKQAGIETESQDVSGISLAFIQDGLLPPEPSVSGGSHPSTGMLLPGKSGGHNPTEKAFHAASLDGVRFRTCTGKYLEFRPGILQRTGLLFTDPTGKDEPARSWFQCST